MLLDVGEQILVCCNKSPEYYTLLQNPEQLTKTTGLPACCIKERIQYDHACCYVLWPDGCAPGGATNPPTWRRTGFHEGDSVVAANSAPCQYCFYCRRGRYSLCENLLFLNGAYAEYLLVPERIVRQNLYKLEPGTSFVAAAMTEPLACALHGIEASDIHPGDTVVVIGAGPLGLLLAAIAKQHGAYVVITGRGAQRLSLAHYYGADVVIDANAMSFQEQEAVVRSHTDEQRGADVVIEAVGSPETWALAARMARHGGLVNFFGGCPSGTEVSLDTRSVHYGELTAKGIFHHTPVLFQQALELITDHRIDVEGLITARFPLAFTLDVFDMLLRKQGIKYALIPAAFELSLAKPTSHE